ncbi:MAG: FHA domain-containing protein [Lachnospiraceae bacterium]|nr:FHA domain-containing protein [Lachnospiraceae bacterium]
MKSKLRKWVWGICVLLVMSVLGATVTYASDVKKINIEGYDLTENAMRIYLNSDSDTAIKEDNLNIILGDSVYTAEKVTPFADTDEGVSYLVLVDVSGSVTDEDVANTREILTKLVEKKGEQDNISIVEIRNEIVKTDFISDKNALLELIQAMERTREDTNLYLAVREALKILTAEENCHQKKCLVIISDGMDDQKNGILFEDVRDAIRRENIPICTLAMPWKQTTAGSEDAPDKVMKSFTENAAGGVHIRYEDGGLDNEAIADAFLEFSHGGVVVEIALEDFVPNGSNVTLSVELQVGEEMIQGDSCQIPSHEISAVITEKLQEESPEQNGTEVEETDVENTHNSSKAVYVIILVAAVAAMAGLGVAILHKRKPLEENSEKEVPEYALEDISATRAGQDEEPETETKSELHKPVMVTLTEVGPVATRILTAECEDTLVIGRRKSAGLVIAEDHQVSGMHCELRMEKGKMYLRDLDSTNGTFLNGILVTVETQVHQEDIIYIGAFEYRISWE